MLLSTLLTLLPASLTTVTISNLKPRLSTAGTIVNAHDGTVRYIDGMWWMHAAEYGECADPPNHGCQSTGQHNTSCGFEPNHNISIWTSPDLSSGSWEKRGVAIQCMNMPDCSILYRPHMVYNPNTKLYVLFWNFKNKSGRPHAGNAVATATSPAGPFTLVNTFMNTTFPSGDFDIFVDHDGQGYIIYSGHHQMYLERLSRDFLKSTGEMAVIPNGIPPAASSVIKPASVPLAFPVEFVEAPVLMERKGLYYALFGHCCCFCYQGSGMFVFTASHVMGPWKQQLGRQDLGCIANTTTPTPAEIHSLPMTAEPTPGQGCLYGNAEAASATRAQQNFVIEVPSSDGDSDYIWTGDRWMQAPDGIKGHEPQTWTRLAFDADGNVLPLKWVDELVI